MVESAAKPASLTRKLSNWKIAKTGFNAQYFCANSHQVETPQHLSFSVSWAQLYCFPEGGILLQVKMCAAIII